MPGAARPTWSRRILRGGRSDRNRFERETENLLSDQHVRSQFANGAASGNSFKYSIDRLAEAAREEGIERLARAMASAAAGKAELE
ncbi:hypothetical protein VQ056_31215 [Paenibacillus sp. JTLBN-2024]